MFCFNVYYRSPFTNRLCRYQAWAMSADEALGRRKEVNARLFPKGNDCSWIDYH